MALEKLSDIDRRYIYLLLLVLLAYPVLFPIGLPIQITHEARTIYDDIEAIPEGSLVVMQMDYSAGHAAELGPKSRAIIQHMFMKRLKIIMPCFEPEGPAQTVITMDGMDTFNAVYGEDWVQLPYMVGGESAVAAFASNWPSIVTTDHFGNPLEDMSIMKLYNDANDVVYWFAMGGGSPAGGGSYGPAITQVVARYGTPLGVGALAWGAPLVYPYYESGTIAGLLIGQRGAAEYELLINKPMSAVASTDSISISHLYVVLLIALGNVGYFSSKFRGERK